jgi:hypothetical protein
VHGKENIYIDGRMISKCILEKYDGMAWIGLIWIPTGGFSRRIELHGIS